MRILLTIPHYFDHRADSGRHGASVDAAEFRINTVTRCLLAIHQLFGRSQCMMQLSRHQSENANGQLSAEVHVVFCTCGSQHLLDQLAVSRNFYQQHPVQCEPEMVGFECRTVLRDRWGNYDWYGYMEDDLIHQDPWFFSKLDWFQQQAGPEAVLLPNRFERGSTPLATKAYVDGDLREQVTQPYQDVTRETVLSGSAMGVPVEFRRPLNPHSGCYFLTAEQMSSWIAREDFADRDVSFIGPLESAATLGLMKAFRIYKPHLPTASFLEIEHAGQRFISQLRQPESEDRT
jgi:hypothetical protein